MAGRLLLLSVWGAGRRPGSFLTGPWGGRERVCLPPGTLRSTPTPFPPALLGDTRCLCSGGSEVKVNRPALPPSRVHPLGGHVLRARRDRRAFHTVPVRASSRSPPQGTAGLRSRRGLPPGHPFWRLLSLAPAVSPPAPRAICSAHLESDRSPGLCPGVAFGALLPETPRLGLFATRRGPGSTPAWGIRAGSAGPTGLPRFH